MQGLMQDWPLTVDRILDHAALRHPSVEIVSRSVEGPITRVSYAELHGRAKQVSHALLELGIAPGDRVGTLAWNTGRHMEAWYGIMGIGAVCHTLNPRLHPDQLWLDHQERRRPGDPGRPQLRPHAAGGARPPGDAGGAGGAAQRRGAPASAGRAGRADVRGLDRGAPRRRRRRRAGLGALRRADGVRALLHLGYDGRSQGGALLPPLQLPAHLHDPAGGT